MIISKTAIKEYFNKEMNDWSFVRDIDYISLYEEVKHYYPSFNPKYKLRFHQLVSLFLCIQNDSFLLFLEPGLGKTYISLLYCLYLKDKGYVNKTLVLVPNTILVEGWIDEVKKFTDLTCTGLVGSSKDKWQTLYSSKESDIFVTAYKGLEAMVCKNQRGRMVITNKIDDIIHMFDMVIYDEIHHCSNSKALITKICDRLSDNIAYRLGLTGTPFGRNLMNLWAQFNLIDHGDTLGSKAMFKFAFFKVVLNYMGFPEDKFKDNLRPVLKKRMSNKSIFYSLDECLDLPEINYQVIKVPMSRDGLIFYNQTISDIIDSKGEVQVIQNSFVRLRNLTSGYMSFLLEDERKDREEFFHNPKFDALLEILEEILPSKVVIFYEYNVTGDIIQRELKTNKIKSVRLRGGLADKKKKEQLDKFLKKDCSILLINTKLGEGLNLQESCNYCIFYETSPSPIVRTQNERRIHRIGQGKKVIIYDVVVRNSIDEKILFYLKEGKDLFDEILKGSTRIERL